MGLRSEAGVKQDGKAANEVNVNAAAGPLDETLLTPLKAPALKHRLRHNLKRQEVPYGLQLAGITTGYRQGGTYMDCLWTLFTWHNQTLNSWTMIWGWMLSCGMLWWTLLRLRPRGADLAAFLAMWLCPTLHLPFTVGYHQFLCISPGVLRHWRALDVAFIFIASVPLTYGISYFVLPLPYAVALTGVTVSLSLHAWHNAAALPAGADINKRANTRYVGLVVLVYTFPILLQAALDLHSSVFLSLRPDSNPGGAPGGASAAAAPVPATATHDPLYTCGCAAAIVFCFLYGGASYVLCYPDIYAPGVFDIVGSAQQLMHIAIAGAHAVEWLFVIHMYQRNNHPQQGGV